VRRYRYVGPEAVRSAVATDHPGVAVRSCEELACALETLDAADGEPWTYVVDLVPEEPIAREMGLPMRERRGPPDAVADILCPTDDCAAP
jgi:hypothetical protein